MLTLDDLKASIREQDRVDEQVEMPKSAALELLRRLRLAAKALEPFKKLWNGDQDGTTRLPWDAVRAAAFVRAELLKPLE